MKFTVNESNKVKHRKQKVLVYTNIDTYIYIYLLTVLLSTEIRGHRRYHTSLSSAPFWSGGIDQPSVITAACRPPSYGRAQRT